MCEIIELWWPERRKVRIRYFDNLAEALAGQVPGNCTMHDSCDSYVVVEYNGDIYPCDFFVEKKWKMGNVNVDSWTARHKRQQFAANKTSPPIARSAVLLPLPGGPGTARTQAISGTSITSARLTR
jgi:uncharacterized protein